MANWLKNILDDVNQRAAGRPEWQYSEYAQAEIARIRTSTSSTTSNTTATQHKDVKTEVYAVATRSSR